MTQAPRLFASLLLPLLATLAACSSLQTSYDFDTQEDFSKLRVYDWKEPPVSDNTPPLIRERIVKAVDTVLAEKGFERGSPADFHLAARTGTQTKLSVQDWGYTYGPYGTWWPQRDVSVQEYEVGTLVLDVIAAEPDKLIWRGTASDTIDRYATPEKITERVDRAVRKVLEAFPPPAR